MPPTDEDVLSIMQTLTAADGARVDSTAEAAARMRAFLIADEEILDMLRTAERVTQEADGVRIHSPIARELGVRVWVTRAACILVLKVAGR